MVVTQSETQPAVLGIRSAFVVGLLFLWIAVHVLLPFRHLLIPGNVNWTEEGHRFAWHMKLRDKKAKTTFFAVDPDTNERWPIQHNDYLESWQYRKMSTRPYMIHQFAKHLRDELEADGHKDVEIYVDSRVSLNGRPRHVLIDPDVNLAAEPIVYWRSDWIVPLPNSPPGRN